MLNKRVKNILLKEWQVALHDLNSLLMVTLLPLLIIAQAVTVFWAIQEFAVDSILGLDIVQKALSNLIQTVPAVGALPAVQQIQVFLLSQMMFYILLIPTMIAVNSATFSIVEEKLSGSLEALLATPLHTWELLFGKALAGAVPAVILTWICTLIFFLAVRIMGWGALISLVVTPAWYITILLLAPLMALLSFLLGVIGSSRAKDAKSAQNSIILIIFPVFGLIALQVTGALWFTVVPTILLGILLAGVNALALWSAVKLFRRESVVIRWK